MSGLHNSPKSVAFKLTINALLLRSNATHKEQDPPNRFPSRVTNHQWTSKNKALSPIRTQQHPHGEGDATGTPPSLLSTHTEVIANVKAFSNENQEGG